ncbi:chromosome partition protein Smc-like [Plodia interpunctella]|uniref:chromosome partition protein Smc-like n=1 Tax=Plodia interpunctella TaxID=58824 RepID=UPI002367F16B|nr:chromosome partition protein Smc-like [Plodia interpunctella]
MGINSEFDSFEQQFLQIIAESRSTSDSERRLRDELRSEATRAESSEVARCAADRAAAEARRAAAAAAAGATQAAASLTIAQEEITNLKMQLEITERQRDLLEERCVDLSGQVTSLEKELQELRPLQLTCTTLQRQYAEMQDRVRIASEDTRREVTRLENELRRVERCAAAGSELRERARLAAAAHVRERRLATAELQYTSRELLTANAEITRLNALVAELQIQLENRESGVICSRSKDHDAEALGEVRAALEAERAGAARLEQALAAAVADNSALAARLHAADNTPTSSQPAKHADSLATDVCPINSFLAE